MASTFNLGGQPVNVPDGFPHGGLGTLQTYLNNFLTLFMLIGMFLMVIYIVWSGIQWITSGGDKQKLASARGRLTWAVVGFIILMLSFFVVNAVGYFFKVNLLKLA